MESEIYGCGIRNPQRGVRNPRLSWSPVFRDDCWFQVEKELASLAMSEVPESNEKKGALVMKLKCNLIFELNKLLFNNTSDSKGGEEVRTLFKTFHDSVFKVSRRLASY